MGSIDADFSVIPETFSTPFSKLELREMHSIGDVFKAMRNHWRLPHSDRCLTAAAFYGVRRGLVDGAGIERAIIRPAAHLSELIPVAGRRSSWTSVQHHSPLQLPCLERPTWLVLSLAALVVGIAGCAWWLAPGAIVGFLLAVACSGLLGWTAAFVTTPLARNFPCETIGDMSRCALRLNFPLLTQSRGYVNEHEAWDLLVTLIQEQTGASKEEILWDTPLLQLFK